MVDGDLLTFLKEQALEAYREEGAGDCMHRLFRRVRGNLHVGRLERQVSLELSDLCGLFRKLSGREPDRYITLEIRP